MLQSDVIEDILFVSCDVCVQKDFVPAAQVSIYAAGL